ncbi:MAG TPA: GNAT family N-acetyltransferase [Hyphomicrobiaceae bacterium]|nr:GNAT family N-acetyltransferase [Hyphomicrobiaceae bacterium]
MPEVRIARLVEIDGWERLIRGIEAIFFAASGRTFSDDAERAAFRERWLGRYLQHDVSLTHVALTGDAVAGYIVGSHDDPAKAARFADLAFFGCFASLTAAYPGQLHINLDARYRSRGIGGRLIEAFMADARGHGVPGVHVVTGAASRNVTFYERSSFEPSCCAAWNGRRLLMLKRLA